MFYEEEIIDGVLCCRYGPNAEFKPFTARELTDKLAFVAAHVRNLTAQSRVVPEGYVIEGGSEAYKEIIVTAPDDGQQVFWPEDAAYGIIQGLLSALQGQNNDPA